MRRRRARQGVPPLMLLAAALCAALRHTPAADAIPTQTSHVAIATWDSDAEVCRHQPNPAELVLGSPDPAHPRQQAFAFRPGTPPGAALGTAELTFEPATVPDARANRTLRFRVEVGPAPQPVSETGAVHPPPCTRITPGASAPSALSARFWATASAPLGNVYTLDLASILRPALGHPHWLPDAVLLVRVQAESPETPDSPPTVLHLRPRPVLTLVFDAGSQQELELDACLTAQETTSSGAVEMSTDARMDLRSSLAGLQFLLTSIPAGAIVEEATLVVAAPTEHSLKASLHLDTAVHSRLQPVAGDLSRRLGSSTTPTATLECAPSASGADPACSSSSLAAAIQELISSKQWMAGQPITIIVQRSASATTASSELVLPTFGARLHLRFRAPIRTAFAAAAPVVEFRAPSPASSIAYAGLHFPHFALPAGATVHAARLHLPVPVGISPCTDSAKVELLVHRAAFELAGQSDWDDVWTASSDPRAAFAPLSLASTTPSDLASLLERRVDLDGYTPLQGLTLVLRSPSSRALECLLTSSAHHARHLPALVVEYAHGSALIKSSTNHGLAVGRGQVTREDAEVRLGGAFASAETVTFPPVPHGMTADELEPVQLLMFTNVAVPPNSRIVSAVLHHPAHTVAGGSFAARIFGVCGSTTGHGCTSASPFANSGVPATSTASSVAWAPTPRQELQPAPTLMLAPLALPTPPDLRAVLQELVDAPGWFQGEAVVLAVIRDTLDELSHSTEMLTGDLQLLVSFVAPPPPGTHADTPAPPEPTMCALQHRSGVTWAAVEMGQVAVQTCPAPSSGKMSRACTAAGQWAAPDSSECFLPPLQTAATHALSAPLAAAERASALQTLHTLLVGSTDGMAARLGRQDIALLHQLLALYWTPAAGEPERLPNFPQGTAAKPDAADSKAATNLRYTLEVMGATLPVGPVLLREGLQVALRSLPAAADFPATLALALAAVGDGLVRQAQPSVAYTTVVPGIEVSVQRLGASGANLWRSSSVEGAYAHLIYRLSRASGQTVARSTVGFVAFETPSLFPRRSTTAFVSNVIGVLAPQVASLTYAGSVQARLSLVMHEETVRQISVFLKMTHLSSARDPEPRVVAVRKDGLVTMVYIKHDGRSRSATRRRRAEPATADTDTATVTESSQGHMQLQCVQWQETTQLWSEQGCSLTNANSGSVVCTCSAPGYMAVQASWVGSQESDGGQAVEGVLADLGRYGMAAFGMVCLLVVAVSLVVMVPARNIFARHVTSINICCALVAMSLVFLFTKRPEHFAEGPCRLFGAAFHYFALVAVLWTMVDAFVVWDSMRDLLDESTGMKRQVQRLSPLVWLLPAIVVTAIYEMVGDSYATDSYCFLDVHKTIVISIAGPVVLAFAISASLYAVSCRSIPARGGRRDAFRSAVVLAVGTFVSIAIALTSYAHINIAWEVLFGLVLFLVGAHTVIFNYHVVLVRPGGSASSGPGSVARRVSIVPKENPYMSVHGLGFKPQFALPSSSSSSSSPPQSGGKKVDVDLSGMKTSMCSDGASPDPKAISGKGTREWLEQARRSSEQIRLDLIRSQQGASTGMPAPHFEDVEATGSANTGTNNPFLQSDFASPQRDSPAVLQMEPVSAGDLGFSSYAEGHAPPCPSLSREGSVLFTFQGLPTFPDDDHFAIQTPSRLEAMIGRLPRTPMTETRRHSSSPRINPFGAESMLPPIRELRRMSEPIEGQAEPPAMRVYHPQTEFDLECDSSQA